MRELSRPRHCLNLQRIRMITFFVECADAARADYLVSGNQRHFSKFWKGTKIISSREFLSLIAPHLID